MSFLLDLDPFVLPRVIVETFRHAWRKDANPATETLHSLFGTNTWSFFIPMDCGRSRKQIDRLLASYGIKVFGSFTFRRELIVSVRIGQAAFAQWLLLREGIPLNYGLLADSSGRVARPHRNELETNSTRGKLNSGHRKFYDRSVIDNTERRLDSILARVGEILGL